MDHALEHFDNYYKPIFGSLWPSLRLALLSQQKYCALLNSFSEDQTQVANLISFGANDIIKTAELRDLDVTEEDMLEKHNKLLIDNLNKKIEVTDTVATDDYYDFHAPPEGDDLHTFMPETELVIASEIDRMKQKEIKQSYYIPTQIDVNIRPGTFPVIPFHLKALAFDMNNTEMFPPSGRGRKLNYYLMDASSLLPVLALDLTPECTVLDLCAAPGGKSLAILQTLLPSKLSCVDHSWGRVKRMKGVFRDYLPKSYVDDHIVNVYHCTGSDFVNTSSEKFDKVLVDVPCFTDRHVLHTEDNNIFRSSRLEDRLQIQAKQQDLLFHGIKACKPGGTIVYSTCTLAAPQNDGVIQNVLERIWQETNIDLVIEDTKLLSLKFQDTFHFYDKCRFGRLVIPRLNANFGPLYFCKLRRLS